MNEPSKNYQQGRLYSFDGITFNEVEPAIEKKLPVTDEALEAVKQIRARIGKAKGLRPELSLCASAMLLAAAELKDLDTHVYALARQVWREA